MSSDVQQTVEGVVIQSYGGFAPDAEYYREQAMNLVRNVTEPDPLVLLGLLILAELREVNT